LSSPKFILKFTFVMVFKLGGSTFTKGLIP
jgi:hypothetical protein